MGMLSYFPKIYPDELLYSILARFHRHTCSGSPKQTLDDLFGSRSVRASIALQGSLGALCDRIPLGRGLTPGRLARDTTLFPYYTAFEPAEVARSGQEAMVSGSAEAIHVRLGIAASKVPVPACLRYCPECRSQMLREQGELYWRRVHQLPGVLVCPDHCTPLADSCVRIADLGQHDFVAADATNCPSVVSVPRWASEPMAMRLLERIAIESSLVLVEQGALADLTQLGMEYRQALIERGFARGRCQVNWDRLNAAFTQVMGPVLEMVPGAARGQSGDDWLMGIARKHRKAFHPLRHILLRLFLADTPVTSTAVVAMKSRGPTKSKRDREEVRARWLAARQTHPAWPRKQLAKGYPAEFSWLYRHDRQWLQENSPAPLERGGSPGRVDWPMVDQHVAGSVRAAAEMVKAIKPPVRVTLIEIERRLAKPAWIGKRAGKLPLTIAAVGEVVERLEDFQLRRIAWAAHELEMQGLPAQAWRIRRIAGLPKGLSPRIEARLASFDSLEADVRWY